MTDERTKHWLADQFEKNLFAVLVGGVMIWSTFQNNDAETARRLASIDETLVIVHRDLRRNSSQQVCNVRTLDKIADKTGVIPPCPLVALE